MSLNAEGLARALVRPGGLWRQVVVAPQVTSTNTELLAMAQAGEPEGTVFVALEQTAARGRRGRPWVSPPGKGLTFSVLLRPGTVPAEAAGWVPLLAGVAVAAAIRSAAGVAATVKWPNDVLADGAKLAGILAESCGGAIVVGVGINVSQRRAELPVPGATSLALAAGSPPAPDELLVAVLGELARRYLAWRDQPTPGDAGACGLREEYRRACATLGREVAVALPGGQVLAGTATGLDAGGRLEVATAGGLTRVSAGDVVHVR
jgi:BirA family transcriptional regulator, biotin operon repressor / biotin---[acetyl-CoA-carboxylase] ligase